MTVIQIIANPAAGRGRGAKLIPLIERHLGSAGFKFELHSTETPGHAADLALSLYQDGHRTVIALGGDGTTNEVVNGLFRSAEVDRHPGVVATLGVIPAGSGNDFSYPFSLPTNPEAACRCIVRGHTQIIDVGRVRSDNEKPRFFINGLGVGFDAVVNIENLKIRRLRGSASYILALLRTVAFYYSAPRVHVLYDGKVFEGESLMLSVMNGRRLGGVFMVAPRALFDDGLFDLALFRRMSRLKILRIIPALMRGGHLQHSELIKMARARHIIIDIDGTLPAHVDGEIYSLGAHHYEISIYPRHLRVIC